MLMKVCLIFTLKFSTETNMEKALRLYAGRIYVGKAADQPTSDIMKDSDSEMAELSEYGDLVEPALESFTVSTGSSQEWLRPVLVNEALDSL